MAEKQSILVILGKGGHTEQLLKLVDMLGEKYRYEYAIGRKDHLSQKKITKPGRVFFIQNYREMEDKSLIPVIFKVFKTAFQSINVLMKCESNVILTCGPAIGIPISVLGKLLFRKKLIFLESWSRVYSKSTTGKWLYNIADISFIQWPQQKKNYPNAVYAGRLG